MPLPSLPPDMPPKKGTKRFPKTESQAQPIPPSKSATAEEQRRRKARKAKKEEVFPDRQFKLPELPPVEAPVVVQPEQVPDGPSILDGRFDVRTERDRRLDELRRTVVELQRRHREALKLYEPLELQVAFHASRVKTRLVRGSTRSGKTLMCAAEMARAVLNLDPHHKYPRKGVAYLVGYDWAHHGQVVYPKLFKAGAFKCIAEPDGKLVAYRPWDARHTTRRDEVVEAEPLIPERYIDTIAWYSKREEIPNLIRMTNGWELHFFSGDGRPPRGQAVDLAWMDEEIGNQYWFNELVSRTADRDGRIMWSAAPQSGTDQLYELHELAEMQRDAPDRVVEEFHVRLADNPHLTSQQKLEMAAAKTSEAARITDIDGEFLYATLKVYPEFSLAVHGVAIPELPAHWTRYAVVDPGHTVCAVLFAAVPPPDEQAGFGRVLLYDELYIEKCSAALFADRFRGKAVGVAFQDFVMDLRGGRTTMATTGKTIQQQYSEELEKRGVRCVTRGSGFCWGSDDVAAGVESVRGFLRVGGDGVPGLRVWCERSPHGSLISKLPKFEWEMNRYRYKKVGKVVTDKPEDRGPVHAVACVRYLCAYNPRFVERPQMGREPSWAYRQLQDKRRRENAGKAVGIRLGVGRSA